MGVRQSGTARAARHLLATACETWAPKKCGTHWHSYAARALFSLHKMLIAVLVVLAAAAHASDLITSLPGLDTLPDFAMCVSMPLCFPLHASAE